MNLFKQFSAALLALIVFIQFTGCAAVFNGSRQKVTIDARQDSVEVTINGELLGVTPLLLDLKRDGDYRVTMSKEGFPEKSFYLDTQINEVMIATVLLVGPLFLLVDYLVGAHLRFEQKYYYIDLGNNYGVPLGTTVQYPEKQFRP